MRSRVRACRSAYALVAEPDDKWTMGLEPNCQPVEVKRAYGDVYPLGCERTFTGFEADVSHLKTDTRYSVEVALPSGLQPGQFQGLFFENVGAEFTQPVSSSRLLRGTVPSRFPVVGRHGVAEAAKSR